MLLYSFTFGLQDIYHELVQVERWSHCLPSSITGCLQIKIGLYYKLSYSFLGMCNFKIFYVIYNQRRVCSGNAEMVALGNTVYAGGIIHPPAI